MADSRVFQILTHYTAREDLDPGFDVIDNSANERPDWFEYWPIRKFLLGEALDEDAFYGFLSPKFRAKTNLTAAQVFAFISHCASTTDVVIFSPSIHSSAHFLNVFEQGDAVHPGLLATAKQLLARIGSDVDLDDLITDSRNTVHSNYFVAKPRFWRRWLALNEHLFGIAEAGEDSLAKALTATTPYRRRSQVQMKVFIMERMASLLLASEPNFCAQAHNPFVAERRIYKLPLAIVSDALKIAYRTQGFSQYKEVFYLIRALRKFWNFQIRIGAWMRLPCIRLHTRRLTSYWHGPEN